jgi:iron(III) transport system permease protein
MEGTPLHRSVITVLVACFMLGCCLPLVTGVFSTFISHRGLDISHYSAIFSESRRAGLFLNTVLIALAVTCISLCLGLSYAFAVIFTDIPCRELFLVAAVFPLLVPPYISAIAWLDIAGFIRQLADALNLSGSFFNPCSAAGVIFTMVCSYFPLVTLTACHGMKNIDSGLIDQSRLVHGDLRTIIRIIMPLLTPQIFTGAILVFVYAVSNYGVPSILMFPVFSVEIMSQISTFYDHREAVIYSAPLVMISLLAVVLQGAAEGRRRFDVVSGHRGKGAVFETGRLMIPMLVVIAVTVLCSSAVPVLFLIMRSIPLSSYLAAISVSWPDIAQSLQNSAIIATAAVIIGGFMAYHIERSGRSLKKIVNITAFIPFAVPPSLMALEMLRLASANASVSLVRDSVFFAIYFFCFRFMIFPIKIVSASVSQIDAELEEASLFTGASLWKRCTGILIALNKNSIITAWLLVYILSMGDLEMNLLVLPPGAGSLPVRIFNMQHLGRMEVVSALCIINIALLAVPAGFYLNSLSKRAEANG